VRRGFAIGIESSGSVGLSKQGSENRSFLLENGECCRWVRHQEIRGFPAMPYKAVAKCARLTIFTIIVTCVTRHYNAIC
jgi:hypothetical protein